MPEHRRADVALLASKSPGRAALQIEILRRLAARCGILWIDMASEPDVFVSYAEDTKPLVEELARALQKQGIQAWVDFQDLRPGQRLSDEIEHALEKAAWVLIVVGSNSKTTPWVEAEWRAVLAKVWSDSEKTLIPVVVGRSDPPPFLRNWVSLRVDPDAEPVDWTRHVLDALRSVRNRNVHGLSASDRRQRALRLDEISIFIC